MTKGTNTHYEAILKRHAKGFSTLRDTILDLEQQRNKMERTIEALYNDESIGTDECYKLKKEEFMEYAENVKAVLAKEKKLFS